MELKKRFNYRNAFIVLYFVAFVIYIVIGLKPADAKNYNISANLQVPSIGLSSDVTSLQIQDGKLDTPDYIVGSFSRSENKTLLIGHSSTVFNKLHLLNTGEVVKYDTRTYVVSDLVIMPKDQVDMTEILAESDEDTLVIMTCAGLSLGGGDSTHRLILTAVSR